MVERDYYLGYIMYADTTIHEGTKIIHSTKFSYASISTIPANLL